MRTAGRRGAGAQVAGEIPTTECRELIIEDHAIPGMLREHGERLAHIGGFHNLGRWPAQLEQHTKGRAIELVIIDD
jgi:hypothetical protein